MEDYFRRKEDEKSRMNAYVDRLCKLSIEDLEILLSKIYYKQEHTKRNGIQLYDPIPNIEYVIVNFIEKVGKDVSYEYNMRFHPEDTTYDYWDIEARLLSTNERQWISCHIMSKSWFESFTFEELPINLCKCNKCGKEMLYSETFRLLDDNNEEEDNLEPISYFYCKEHYLKIKELL